MLKLRILTAIVLIPSLLLALFFLSPSYFCVLTAFITIGCAWEWSNLMQLSHILHRFIYLVIFITLMFSLMFVAVPIILAIACLWWLLACIFVIFYQPNQQWKNNFIIAKGIMGCFVLIPCWLAINIIRNANASDGIYGLLFLFILIWSADSVAYFAGKKWGKHKLAPLISPGKSIEGAGAALIAGTFVAIFALWLSQAPLGVWPWSIALSLMTILFSILGDLFESMLKRMADLKDSGNLLPGHGGVLDRIDSLTAAAPVFAWGAYLLGKYLTT